MKYLSKTNWQWVKRSKILYVEKQDFKIPNELRSTGTFGYEYGMTIWQFLENLDIGTAGIYIFIKFLIYYYAYIFHILLRKNC